MMEFLYFPEDKTEYIPAFIILVIFMIGAIGAMMYFYKKSKKEEKIFEDKYLNKNSEVENRKAKANLTSNQVDEEIEKDNEERKL